MEFVKFSWIDYTLFGLMFGLSAAVGIYFGCFGKKQATTADYLLGGRNMKMFPVSMSLVASTLSGITLLGIPAEIYMHGTQYSMMALSVFFMGIINHFLFLPVFYELQLTNVFEYLELRFHKNTKTMASVLYTLSIFLFLPVVIYAPSLAFNQVTGFDLHIIAPVMSLICIFYTTIGGLKAVVWTDTLQFSVTLCTLGCVFVVGTISVGGLAAVWEKADLGGRIEFFNMNPDPTVRNTFWAVVLGNTFFWLSWIGAGPAAVQRFMALPTLNDAKKSLWIFVVLTIITKLISCFSGLIMYANYFDCDPLSAGQISRADQVLPYFVLEVASSIPGLSGLFVAGLFSTALSTLSTYLNTLSGICYRDFIAPFMSENTSDPKASTIMKLLTAVIGLISVCMIFVVERLGSVLELMVSLTGICSGPILGTFMLGLLFPFANEKGVLWGGTCSLLLMSLVVVKNQIHVWNGIIRHPPKQLVTYGCNITTTSTPMIKEILISSTTTGVLPECSPDEPFWLFRISFYYYFLTGILVVLIVGLPTSWACRTKRDVSISPDLVSPCVRRFIPKSDPATLKIVEMKKNVGQKEPALDKLLK